MVYANNDHFVWPSKCVGWTFCHTIGMCERYGKQRKRVDGDLIRRSVSTVWHHIFRSVIIRMISSHHSIDTKCWFDVCFCLSRFHSIDPFVCMLLFRNRLNYVCLNAIIIEIIIKLFSNEFALIFLALLWIHIVYAASIQIYINNMAKKKHREKYCFLVYISN